MKYKLQLILFFVFIPFSYSQDMTDACDLEIAFYPIDPKLHGYELIIPSESLEGHYRLHLNRFQKSRYINYKGKKNISLKIKSKTQSIQGKIQLSKTSGSYILFLDTHATNKFRYFLLQDDINYRPNNTLSFINLTNRVLEAKLDDEIYRIKKGLNPPMLFGEIPQKIDLSLKHNNKSFVVLSTTWSLSKQHRKVMLLLPPKEKQSFKIRCIHLTDEARELSIKQH